MSHQRSDGESSDDDRRKRFPSLKSPYFAQQRRRNKLLIEYWLKELYLEHPTPRELVDIIISYSFLSCSEANKKWFTHKKRKMDDIYQLFINEMRSNDELTFAPIYEALLTEQCGTGADFYTHFCESHPKEFWEDWALKHKVSPRDASLEKFQSCLQVIHSPTFQPPDSSQVDYVLNFDNGVSRIGIRYCGEGLELIIGKCTTELAREKILPNSQIVSINNRWVRGSRVAEIDVFIGEAMKRDFEITFRVKSNAFDNGVHCEIIFWFDPNVVWKLPLHRCTKNELSKMMTAVLHCPTDLYRLYCVNDTHGRLNGLRALAFIYTGNKKAAKMKIRNDLQMKLEALKRKLCRLLSIADDNTIDDDDDDANFSDNGCKYSATIDCCAIQTTNVRPRNGNGNGGSAVADTANQPLTGIKNNNTSNQTIKKMQITQFRSNCLRNHFLHRGFSQICQYSEYDNMDTLGSFVYLVKGVDSGINAWYYVFIPKPSRADFEDGLKEDIIQLEEFGTVLESAFGDKPPADVAESMSIQYFCQNA